MMTPHLKTPDFVSEKKSFKTYEKDLRLWSRLTTVAKKNQAEWIVLNLDGHPSGIKDKIQTSIGESLKKNKDGIEALITFLKTIYDLDEFRDCYDTYSEFEEIKRAPTESISDFIQR